MRNNSSIKIGLITGIAILFILSAVTPMTLGDSFRMRKEYSVVEDLSIVTVNGPLDSPWPMYCHDVRHTGRSPYSTSGNPGLEKWWFKTDGFVDGSAAIDSDGIIYFGSHNDNFYALYPDGSLKWSYDIGGNVDSTGPAIDEDGVIYVVTAFDVISGNRMFAFYPDGTVKWTYFVGDEIFSAPVIGDDGMIYFGYNVQEYPWYGYIAALYPNGTLNWRYKTDDVIYSDPAIGLDGTIYCGSHDGYLYAFYPNNGTLKWKYKTDGWVGRGPCIGDDGIIYFGSWDSHLYAVYPNGSLKWKTQVSAVTTPVIAEDGTIYVGNGDLSAVNSDDGSIKWKYGAPGPIRGGNPCISSEGIIIFATMDPSYLVAVNPDGTERWQKPIGGKCLFAPIIAEDGTIYVGSSNEEWTGTGYQSKGYLHAFGELEPNAPSAPDINGPSSGRPNKEYDFTFSSTSPLGRDVYYCVDWAENMGEEWVGPYNSGEEITLSHKWSERKVYNIQVRAKDTDNLWGPLSGFKFSTPRNKATSNALFYRFLEQFPNAFPILRQLLGL